MTSQINSIYDYEVTKWRELQSNYTKFLSLLDKNKHVIENKDLYTLKLLQLNSLVDQIDVVLDDIKYECIYTNSKYSNSKKINNEINNHLNSKKLIKSLVKFQKYN